MDWDGLEGLEWTVKNWEGLGRTGRRRMLVGPRQFVPGSGEQGCRPAHSLQSQRTILEYQLRFFQILQIFAETYFFEAFLAAVSCVGDGSALMES